MEKKRKLIILTGPTAVGKTEASIHLAKGIGGEIISADSIQVYQKMNIGSAKILPEEMEGVPHYLVDCLDPKEEFSVYVFQKMCKEAMEIIYQKGKIPIIVGGTGFYIQSVLYDIDFSKESTDHSYRKELETFAREKGNHALWERLREVDPASAKAIHENNRKRVIRALEYFKEEKSPISKHNEEQRKKTSPFDFCYFVLNRQRETLYQRINERVDQMVQQGLEQEVLELLQDGYDPSLTSMQGIGYREMISYLKGNLTKEEAIEEIKKNTRHFAKRQITWFKREPDTIWVNYEHFHNSVPEMVSFMEESVHQLDRRIIDHRFE